MIKKIRYSAKLLSLSGGLAVILLGVAAALTSTAWHSQGAHQRPRVGLAMNGEGAIGFTQIGVLQWMQEHHVPVDYIAGTSVGGLIGGGYATGMSPYEIRAFVEKIDFTTTLFLGEAPYQEKGKWTKSEKIKLPGVPGLPGLELDAFMPSKAPDMIVPLLPGIAKPYRNLRSFDDLPTSFRCPAADLRTGQLFEFASGSLPEALRACITLIGVSSPVRLGDKILVSGAILNSIPVDALRQMGADVVIASFTPPGTVPTEGGDTEFTSLLQQMIRSLDIARTQNEMKALQAADIVIRPDIGSFTAGDLNRLQQLVDLGYAAAQAKGDSLLRFELSDDDWREYLTNRYSRRIR
jgi:NTE family protein